MHELSRAWAKNLAHERVTGWWVERLRTGVKSHAHACITVLLFTPVFPDIYSGSSEMPRLSMETKRRFFTQGKRLVSSRGAKWLAEEEIFVSRVMLYKLWKKYQDTDRIAGTRKPKRVKKLGEEQLVVIDEALVDKDELMARQLHVHWYLE